MADKDEQGIHFTEAPDVLVHVPVPLRVAGAWSWRLIVVGVVAMALFTVIGTLSPIVVPVAIALILAAPFYSVVSALKRIGIPRGAGALMVILAIIVVVLGLITAAGSQVVVGFDSLRDKFVRGVDTVVEWLSEGPLQLEAAQIQDYLDRFWGTVEGNADRLVSGALSITSTVGLVTAGIVIAAISLFFFLKDGRAMWKWVVHLLPAGAQSRVDLAGRAGAKMLDEYTRAQVLVAVIDAVGIGIGAWILVGFQLALPLTIAVFLLSFIPMIGAALSTILSSLVVLVDGGWVYALIMLGIALTVQWVEGNILYPWLFGRAVELHPLVILLSVAVGSLIAGIAGTLLAVPIVGFFYRFVSVLSSPATAELHARRLPDVVTQTIPIARRRKGRATAAK